MSTNFDFSGYSHEDMTVEEQFVLREQAHRAGSATKMRVAIKHRHLLDFEAPIGGMFYVLTHEKRRIVLARELEAIAISQRKMEDAARESGQQVLQIYG